jgi:DNA polymerase I
MNAFYGVFASSFYRFTNPIIGASITAFARENIKNIIKMLEEEGLTVIYSDTDSIFFQSPHQNLKDTIEFGQQMSKRFSKEGVTLEFEKVLEPFFSHGKKKRYIGKALWPKEDTLVRGYEIRRTDSFDLQSEALYAVFDEILSGREENAVKVARRIVEDVKTGNVPLEKLVISRTAQTEESYKDPDSLANVRAARKMKELGYEFTPGMKVAYIVTDSKKDHMDIEPYIEGRKFEHTPDWNYYATRVALSLSRVTDVFGWNEKTLLSGVQQKSLFTGWDKEEEEIEDDNATDEDVIISNDFVEKETPIKNGNIVKKKMKIEDFI